MTIIIGLILLGLMLISFEVIVPGGILGVLGGVAIIGACVLSFKEYGTGGAIGIFIGSIVVTGIMLALELKYLPKTRLGQRMFLKDSINDKSTQDLGTDEIIGKEGKVLTELVPTGRIEIEGKQYEGFSKDGLIREGEAIKVIGRDNFRIIVKKA